jgi:hypothetical protein
MPEALERVAILVRAKMAVHRSLGPPYFLEHKDVLFLKILSDMTTETPGIFPSKLNHRFQDFQNHTTLLGGDCHPNGRLNHASFLFEPSLAAAKGLAALPNQYGQGRARSPLRAVIAK